MILKILSVSFLTTAFLLSFYLLDNSKGKTNSLVNVVLNDRKPVYIGAWTEGFWDNDTKKLNVSSLKEFESKLRQKMALANIYSEWSYLDNEELIGNLSEISQNGWTPIISSNPSFTEGCEDIGKSLYETIAEGNCDEFLRAVGRNLAQFQGAVFLRFAWEMNLPDMYWSVDKVKSQPQDFVNAWRRFYELVEEEGATNVSWVLSFNTSSPKTIPYAELFPGDNYVDWVAIDGYNWGTAQSWSKWTTFEGVFRNSYNELRRITNKPIMLSEVNSAETGGDKSKWLEDMLTVQIPSNFEGIEAVVFFNENKAEGENVDWRIEKSDEYIAAVENGLKLKLYKFNYP